MMKSAFEHREVHLRFFIFKLFWLKKNLISLLIFDKTLSSLILHIYIEASSFIFHIICRIIYIMLN